MEIKEILGDYNTFFAQIIENLNILGVDVTGLPVSHLGYERKTIEEYESVRNALLAQSDSMVENVHNGQLIAKTFS